MTPKEIKTLFPITLIISEKILKSSIYADRNNCIGATLLKNSLPNELHSLIDYGTGLGRVDGVPIKSYYGDGAKKQDHYLQFAQTKVGDIVTFVVDNNRK